MSSRYAVRARTKRKLIRRHKRRRPGAKNRTVLVKGYFRRRRGEAICARCGLPDYRENPDCDHQEDP